MAGTFVEIGSTGLKQFAGFVREEYLRELQGQRGMSKFREMGDDDISTEPGIEDVHSGAVGNTLDGTPYGEL